MRALEGALVPHIADSVRISFVSTGAAPREESYVQSAFVDAFWVVADEQAYGRIVLRRQLERGALSHDQRQTVRLALQAFGYAVRTAMRYESNARIAAAFQSATLDVPLPQIPGITFDAFYRAANATSNVGGDWYETFVLQDGRIVVSVGDVMGSGIQAAVQMMNVRQTIRGVGFMHPDPREMLAAAESTLVRQYQDSFVSTVVGIIDPVTQTFSYANAGHPSVLMRSSAHAVQELGERGPALGVFPELRNAVVGHVSFSCPATFVLYTDGLIEATQDVPSSMHRLREVVAALDDKDFAPALTVYKNMISDGAAVRDDVAILTITIHATSDVRRWRFDPMWSDVAMRVRSEMRQALAWWDADDDMKFRFELIVAELLSNFMRHAPGTVEMLVEFADRPTIHALDNGSGITSIPQLPPDLFSESGRGLFMIQSFAHDVSFRPRPGGGTHTRVVL
jgi:serine phosphatase RsbU (regulator of sigma subunit)/anti-sigma regulatory factor (Ser/Thr protein kinase)